VNDLPQSSPPNPFPPAEPSFDASHPLIVFDGVCVLCSGFVRMVVRLDRKSRFRFATAQSPFGEALFHKHGLRTDRYETNLVLIDGTAFTHLDSFVAVMSELGWPWRAARALLLLPRPLRNWLYERIARNRYALFGRKDSCDIPSAALRERFLG
jgi:predicted DCC family thiol-disulfide oxidoreductase YuxK